MKPIGPLMIEHRLIERTLALFAGERRKIVETGTIDYDLFDSGLDFFRTYMDKFHHGKEEEILFRELAPKPLSPEDRKLLNELLEEHVRMRRAAEQLADARKQQVERSAPMTDITRHMDILIKGYPVHIEKEDKHFFVSSMNYLSAPEQASMLEKIREFDRNFTQQRYIGIIRGLEASKKD